MYDRRYDGKVLTFEASGGLINSSLVLQDRETDSYWAIMRAKSLNGELAGTPMKEIAVNRKMTWKNWREAHPDTLVLSVNGVEDQAQGYDQYFSSSQGFRGSRAEDARLSTKAPIFAFRINNHPYAVSYDSIIGGQDFDIGDSRVFFYRSESDGLHDSTLAYIGDMHTDCEFEMTLGSFTGTDCPVPLIGFDTFWYNWSLNNPDTELLK